MKALDAVQPEGTKEAIVETDTDKQEKPQPEAKSEAEVPTEVSREPDDKRVGTGKTEDRLSGINQNSDKVTGKPGKEKGAGKESKGGMGKFIFLLVVVGLIAAAAYYGWHQYGSSIKTHIGLQPEKMVNVEEPTVTTVSDSLRDEKEEPVDLASDIPEVIAASGVQQQVEQALNLAAQQEEDLANLQTQVANLELELNSQRERLQALSTTSREDWLLAEAEYLLRLANQRILTERQSKNAISLLESTDGILKDLDEAGLFPVRKALANDITQLRAAGIVDKEGIFLKLESLISLVQELQVPVAGPAEEGIPGHETQNRPWYEILASNALSALKKLSGIVRIEKLEVKADRRLLPSEQQILRITVRLALEQAQMALMREEQAIFAASVERARALVAENFQADEKAGTVIAELDEIADIPISQHLPTVTASIRALRDYIALLHNRYTVEGAVKDTGKASATGDEQP